MAGAYDKHLSAAKSQAKGHWGAGWNNLPPEMQNAYVCRYLVGSLGGIDIESAFGTGETEQEKKLIGRLSDMILVLSTAAKFGE